MDDSNKDDHAKTLPKEHDRDAAIETRGRPRKSLKMKAWMPYRPASADGLVLGQASPRSPNLFSNTCSLQPGTARHQALSDVW